MAKTRYVWDVPLGTCLMEVGNASDVQATYVAEPVRRGGVVLQIRDDGINYYHSDGQGTIRQLTSSGGTVTAEYTFSAFGALVTSSGTISNPFQFLGSFGCLTGPLQETSELDGRVFTSDLARWTSHTAWDDTYTVFQNAPANDAQRIASQVVPGSLLPERRLDPEVVNLSCSHCGRFSLTWRYTPQQLPEIAYVQYICTFRTVEKCARSNVSDCGGDACRPSTSKTSGCCFLEFLGHRTVSSLEDLWGYDVNESGEGKCGAKVRVSTIAYILGFSNTSRIIPWPRDAGWLEGRNPCGGLDLRVGPYIPVKNGVLPAWFNARDAVVGVRSFLLAGFDCCADASRGHGLMSFGSTQTFVDPWPIRPNSGPIPVGPVLLGAKACPI